MTNTVQLIVFICFSACIGIQLFYYIFFYSRVAFYKVTAAAFAPTEKPLSVIICARDELKNLQKHLPSLLEQQYNNYELLVVDDVSFDATPFYLEQYKKYNSRLQVVTIKQEAKITPGKKFPLTVGIKTSKNDWLVLTDADCYNKSNLWLRYVQQQFDKGHKIVLGYGPYERKRNFLNLLIRFETVLTALQYFSYALSGIPYMGVGRNLAYHKQLFFEQKGFSKHMKVISGDDDLFIKDAAKLHKTGVMLHPDSFMYSPAKNTWKEWMNQKTRHYGTSKYYNGYHKILLGLFSSSWFFLYPFFIACLFTPWQELALIFFGIRFVFYYIIFGQTLRKLKEKGIFAWLWWLDIIMFFYYLIFSIALWRKPKNTWM
jgi:glycosyltransferase involved in cell wall biosynthesis